MNSENLLRVADAIEKHTINGLGYNQERFLANKEGILLIKDYSGHGCNTTACLSGWTAAVMANNKMPSYEDAVNYLQSAKFLGLTKYEAKALFRAAPIISDHKYLDKVTSDQAVAVLRHAAEHHVIDWSVALKESSHA